MSRWLNHHLQAIQLVLSRFGANKLSSFMIFLVFSVAICLPTLFYIAVDNLTALTQHFENESEVSVFLTLDASDKQRNEIDALLKNHISVKASQFVSKDEAWKDLQDKMRVDKNETQQRVLALKQNPLPDAFFVQTHDVSIVTREALKTSLLTHPAVAEVLINSEWVERLNTLLALGKKLTNFIALLLVGVLLVVVGNTIRMQIIMQKDEIEVSKLMGATNQFIKVPFLYAGVLYGFFGGLLALALVYSITFSLNESIVAITTLYQSDFKLALSYLNVSAMVMSVAVAVGWLGAYIAVSRTIASYRMQ
jgi:cell division transport system permease protein